VAQSYYLTGLKFSSVLEAEVETLKAALASFAAQPAAADSSDAEIIVSVASPSKLQAHWFGLRSISRRLTMCTGIRGSSLP